MKGGGPQIVRLTGELPDAVEKKYKFPKTRRSENVVKPGAGGCKTNESPNQKGGSIKMEIF